MGFKMRGFPAHASRSTFKQTASALKQVEDVEARKKQAMAAGEDMDDQKVKETSTVAGQFLTPTGKGKFYDEDNDITFSDPQGIITMHEGTDMPVDNDYVYKVDSAGNHIITGIKQSK